jgi:CheY-like chemotaxis protein
MYLESNPSVLTTKFMHNKRCLLLIEDDPDDQLFFSFAIKSVAPDYDFHIADNGLKGIEMLLKMDPLPNLIFLDINMPIIDGFTCLSKIKEIDETSNIPIFIFSTSNHPKDILQAKNFGASGYFRKPNDMANLIEKLKNIINSNPEVLSQFVVH